MADGFINRYGIGAYMVVGLPTHDHCKYCGCAIPFDQAYCSMECYKGDHARMRKERLRDIFVAATALGGVAIILILGYLF